MPNNTTNTRHEPRPLGENLQVFPLAVGMWQVSGAHGPIEPDAAVAMMEQYYAAGFTTFDLADHYGPAEDFVGEFHKRLRAGQASRGERPLVAMTKWVPYQPSEMTREVVEAAVSRSARRMQTEEIDLMQFHWWDYGDARFLDALKHLQDLRGEGRIRDIALTNFDTQHVEEILDAGVPIVSNQVQFSVVDRRPLQRLVPLCTERNVRVLAYGTLLGGLVSARFLGGPEPSPRELTTASLRKYKRIVDAWGGWDKFQTLLETLEQIAETREVSLPNVAVAYVLSCPVVSAAIVGCRLGQSEHIEDNLQALSLRLTEDEVARIDRVADSGNDLMDVIGDCGDEYRK